MYNYDLGFKASEESLRSYLGYLDLTEGNILKELDRIEDIRDWVYSGNVKDVLGTESSNVKKGKANIEYKLKGKGSINQDTYLGKVFEEDESNDNLFSTKVNYHTDIESLAFQIQTKDYLVRFISHGASKVETVIYLINKGETLREVKVKQLLIPTQLLKGKVMSFHTEDNSIGIKLESGYIINEEEENSKGVLDNSLDNSLEDRKEPKGVKKDITYYQNIAKTVNNSQSLGNGKQQVKTEGKVNSKENKTQPNNDNVFRGYVGEQIIKERVKKENYQKAEERLRQEEQSNKGATSLKQEEGKYKPMFFKGFKRSKD